MAATNTTLTGSQFAASDITLTADTVDTVTFPGMTTYVNVITDGTAKIYVTVDGSAPTVSGKSSHPIPAVAGAYRLHVGTSSPAVVKLISAGTPTYSVVASYERGG